jgi:hypothetical protein
MNNLEQQGFRGRTFSRAVSVFIMRIAGMASGLLVLSSFLIHAQNTGQTRLEGRITGTVINEEGDPIQGAQVWAQVADRPIIGALRFVESDANGKFEINRLEFETFHVFAKKEDDKYPDIGSSFYGESPSPTVTLSSQKPVSDLTVKIGPKAGVLAGTVSDKVTGKPIGAGFMLRRAKNPANLLSTSQASHYRLLLPAETDITLEVSADGYKTWRYTDPSDSSGPGLIRLSSGTERDLDIELQPTPEHGVFANPKAERVVVRPGILMAVVYGEGRVPCEMQIEPEQSTSGTNELAYMDSDVVKQILSEVMPEEKRGQENGHFKMEAPDGIQTHGIAYENVTISYSSTKEGWLNTPQKQTSVRIQNNDGIACFILSK